MGPVSTRPHFLLRIFLPMFGFSPGPRVELPSTMGRAWQEACSPEASLPAGGGAAGDQGFFWQEDFPNQAKAGRFTNAAWQKKELAKKDEEQVGTKFFEQPPPRESRPKDRPFFATHFFAKRIGGLGSSPDHLVDSCEWRNLAGEAAHADIKLRLKKWLPAQNAAAAPAVQNVRK